MIDNIHKIFIKLIFNKFIYLSYNFQAKYKFNL